MALPRCYLTKDQYTTERKADPSGHEVTIVTIKKTDETIQQGLALKTGFIKNCGDPNDKGIYTNNYPPLLAKYVVAFSVFVRLALAEKAAEDILIFDNGKIVETMSFEVPDFVPLLAKFDNNYKDPKKQALGDPTRKLLIDSNFAALWVSAYRHKNDDLHPKNISVNGLIDWDMLYYDLTSIIKGPRPLSGYLPERPEKAVEIKEQDISRGLTVTSRTHWFTHLIPKNINFFKIFKSNSFSDLATDADYFRQFYTAILKELLAYDKDMLERRLHFYLGDLGLDLHELPPDKRQQLLKYGEASELFYKKDEQGFLKERTFVEHCSQFFAVEHEKFYQVMLIMPEFHEFIVKNQGIYQEIREWFISQNQKLKNPDMHFDPKYIDQTYREIWHNSFMALLCTQLSILNKLANKALEFNQDHLSRSFIMVNYEDIENQAKIEQVKNENETLTHLKATVSAKKKLKKKPRKTKRHSTPNIAIPTKNPYLKANELLKELYDKLYAVIVEYYSKDELSDEDNNELIQQIRDLLRQSKQDIQKLDDREAKKDPTDDPDDEQGLHLIATYLDKFRSGFCGLLKSFQAKNTVSPDLAFSETDSPSPVNFSSSPSSVGSSPKLSIGSPQCSPLNIPTPKRGSPFFSHTPTHKPCTPALDSKKDLMESDDEDDYELIDSKTSNQEIIDNLSQLLTTWLTTTSPVLLNQIIKQAYGQYKPLGSDPEISIFNPLYYNPLKCWRSRYTEVETLLAADKSNHPKMLVLFHQFLFQRQGKWKSSSINTLLIKELCLKMIEHYRHPKQSLACLKLIKNTIDNVHCRVNDKEFDWTHVAETIATRVFNPKQAQLKQSMISYS